MVTVKVAPVVVGSALLSLSLSLAACGEPAPGRKAKAPADARVTQAVSTTDPTPEMGWSLHEHRWETAHPYANRDTQVFTITHPGAAEIRVRFEAFDVENGYDWVKVSTPEGGSAITYTGTLGDFWTKSIPGSSVRIELSTDYSITRHGFEIGGYAVKTDGETWESNTFVWRTPSPYENGEYRIVEIAEPRAIKMKLFFDAFSTEEGYDFVYVYNEAGLLVGSYSGELGSFETPSIEGRKLYVVFLSDESIVDAGVGIASYSFVPEATEPGCICMAVYAPVCGENGKTYGNACNAACEQVPVAHEGECGTQVGDFCGGIAGVTCAEGWSCQLDGDYPDAGGTCVQ